MAIGIGPQKRNVANLYRTAPSDLPTTRGTGFGLTAAVQSDSGIINIDAIERCCEAVGVAFSPHFAVGNDIEPRPFLVADGKKGRVVLSLFQPFRRNAPQFLGSNPWRKATGEFGAVNQPIRLGIASNKRCRQKYVHVEQAVK